MDVGGSFTMHEAKVILISRSAIWQCCASVNDAKKIDRIMAIVCSDGYQEKIAMDARFHLLDEYTIEADDCVKRKQKGATNVLNALLMLKKICTKKLNSSDGLMNYVHCDDDDPVVRWAHLIRHASEIWCATVFSCPGSLCRDICLVS